MKHTGKHMGWISAGGFLAAALLAAPVLAQAPAGGKPDIVAQWNQVVPPPAPEVQSVKLEPATTALLVLDFSGTENPAHGPCNASSRPRCVASLPAVAELIADARRHGVFVVYSVSTSGTRADIAPALQPAASDPVVRSGPDKFVGTQLAALLSAHGIKTVIVTGTAAEGAVLDTIADAILRGKMRAVIPVDGMSSTTLYGEQYVAWHLTHAPGLAGNTVLTRSNMIGF
jgi:nicotinamidase-related amidase